MRPSDGSSWRANQAFPVNKGALCIKGFTSGETLGIRTACGPRSSGPAMGALAPASWDEALDRIAAGCARPRRATGRDAVGVFGGGSLTNEKAYLLGKFARVALGTRNVDYNGRFCMSSAAGAAIKAFGVDRGLPFPRRGHREGGRRSCSSGATRPRRCRR